MPFGMPPDSVNGVFSGWVRIEPDNRVGGIDSGLGAPVADPLWLLARQWQVGEHQARDVGSPVAATVTARVQRVAGLRAHTEAPILATGAAPVEALVEGLPPRLDWRGRVRLGQQFERLARATLTSDAATALIADTRLACPITPPAGADWDDLDDETRRFVTFAARRGAIDGARVMAGASGAPPELVAALRGSHETVTGQPPDAPDDDVPPCWQADRLEHGFALNVHASGPRTTLRAERYRGGRLDWYAFDAAAGLDGAWDVVPAREARPTHLTVSRTPPRWWAFEDAAADPGAVDVATTDLARLLLTELLLTHGDDWLSVPLEVDAGSLVRIERLVVRDVFGTAQSIGSALALAGTPGERFDLFTLSTAGQPRGPGLGPVLFVPRTATFQETSDPVEEVRFLRDEGANAVWAVEHRVCNGMGRTVNALEAWLAHHGRPEADAPAAAADDGPALTWRLASSVPATWIPFAPLADSPYQPDGHTWLVRSTLPNGGSPDGPTRARSHLLGDWRDPLLWLADEAVPRAGAKVEWVRRRARDSAGRTYCWTGRRVTTGRGEGSSGLSYDRVRRRKGR